ncbi:MAG: hypothetical protein SO251_03370 [Candidatus Fimisoma sp.]|nr:hypothetical protein [Candidatus Fimisoma sp.]
MGMPKRKRTASGYSARKKAKANPDAAAELNKKPSFMALPAGLQEELIRRTGTRMKIIPPEHKPRMMHPRYIIGELSQKVIKNAECTVPKERKNIQNRKLRLRRHNRPKEIPAARDSTIKAKHTAERAKKMAPAETVSIKNRDKSVLKSQNKRGKEGTSAKNII